MKHILFFGKHDGFDTKLVCENEVFHLIQLNGIGRIQDVQLTPKEANELREWLNKNLER